MPTSPIDTSSLIPYTEPTELLGADAGETNALRELVERAEDFVLSMAFCDELRDKWYAFGVAPIFAIFLFHAQNTESEDERDNWFWVVAGDIPAGLVLSEYATTPEDALRVYIDQRRDWIEAVYNGESVDDLIPVNVPPTREWAEQLEARLDHLEQFLEEDLEDEEEGEEE